MEYADLNGDNVIDALDQEYQGVNGRANLEYGINGTVSWKNFDLALFFFGMSGRKKPNGGYEELGGLAPGRNSGSSSLNAWNYLNTSTHIPALSTSTRLLGFSSFEIRNASFFNFRQATLGYTLPQSVIGNLNWLTNLRVYFNMENVFYFVDRKGADAFKDPAWMVDQQTSTPGIVGDRLGTFNTRVPKPLRVSLGLNLGF